MLHLGDREPGISVLQGRQAALRLGPGAALHIGRAEGPVNPGRRRMLGERALLPMRGFEIVTGLEMRTADPDQVVEGKGIEATSKTGR